MAALAPIAIRFGPLAGAILLLGCATAAPAPLPTVPQPAVHVRTDTVPPVPASRLALPLELELSWLLPLVSQAAARELQLAQSDWTRVTATGANPEVETRMQASLGALQVSVHKGVVRVQVSVAYWGSVRARASTPFGSVWLTKGTAWGTRDAPGHVTLEVELRPRIDRAFKLTTKTSLGAVRFQAPEGDTLCTTTLVRICISREDAAARVHAELDKAIRKAAPALLATVDAEVAERVDLGSFVAQALSELGTPSGPDQLALHVEALAVGPLTGTQTRLQVNTELAFTVSTGDAQRPAVKVPPKTEPSGIANAVSYDFALSFAALAEHWTRQLAGRAVGDWAIAQCEVLGHEAGGADLLVALTLARDADRLRVFASLGAGLRGTELRIDSARLTAESRAALATLGVPAQALETTLQDATALALTEQAAGPLAQIAHKLSALTLGLSPVTLALTDPTFEALGATGNALMFRAHTTAGAPRRSR